MIIPDQSHINRIRDALWQQPEGCASVMIGAGFSRNARKAGPDAREFPLWRDIAALLCTKLYPRGDSDRLKRAMEEASGTSGFLRLAQEYEAAFGRGALHSLIQELVPDDDYLPDDIHVHLLRLPWRDVFTTNWDTLLERTCPLIADRAYGVVRTYDEIPSAPSPHIVKLHGSFPAHLPFIFTEEDYRTYPKRFAPFVNTVQQAMMETVFCLIGFSGDDPNFLHWSGWVRDNLGESAPKIYLAGWLDLSPHRRRMLEERNVVPIDLALHPQGSTWPEHLRHRYANEWILHTLERGQPYDITDWPTPPNSRRAPIPEHLHPVEDVAVDAPVNEPPRHAVLNEDPATLPERVRAVIRAWKHNREVYPGWLIIPPNKQLPIGRSTHDWEEAILKAVREFPPLERLYVLRELVWRKDNVLEPLSDQAEAVVQNILNDIDCRARKIDGIADSSVAWAEIREIWRELGMTLLTAARRRLDRDAFDRRLAALHPFMNDHPDVVQSIQYEQSLWALYNLDYTALDKLLKEWRPEGCDPAWMTRKAAIMVEIGRDDEAVQLLNRSLSIIRESPGGRRTLARPSREGWTLWLALAFEHGFLRSTEALVEAPPAFRRWRQLSALQCDAFAQKRDMLEALQGDPEKKDGPLFDLGARRGETIRYVNARDERSVAIHRAVRLCEVAGLPPSASGMTVGSDILSVVADRLATSHYALASRIAMRLTTSEDDATFNRVWARSRIAAMSAEEVTTLLDLVTNAVAYALPRATRAATFSDFWVTRLRVAVEALSRLVLRLPPERAEAIFKQALNYYRMEVVAKHPWLKTSADHLLTRSWEALPKHLRANLVLDVLSAPIVGLDGFQAFNQYYPDPGELLIDDLDNPAPARDPETEGRWAETVHLIVRALGIAGEPRTRAALRLVPLAFSGRLTDSEMDLVAQALWRGDRAGSDVLPDGTSLYDWMFLLLPQPEPGLAEQRFRGKWFRERNFTDQKTLDEYLWRVGTALASLRRRQRPMILTAEERAGLSAIVKQWIESPLTSNFDPFLRFGTREAIEGLQSILPEIELPSSVADALFEKASVLNQTNSPAFRLSGAIAKFLPQKLDRITMSVRVGLASDNLALAEEAVFGLHAWLIGAAQEALSLPSPPVDLLVEIGVIIATRKKGPLNRALQLARWVFSDGSSEQRDTIAQPTLHGLRYLMEELRYDRDHGDEGDVEIPLLRWGCAHLALAMLASGYEAEPTVKQWAEVARADPLPEVRHAERPASVRTPEAVPADK
jgi:hypothetical protein